jgi:menaquinone-dependent protoporphyrinogen IX oxidase
MGLRERVEVLQMRAVIIYESMYGNTHLIAEAIARGLQPGNDVAAVPVAKATRELLDGTDLVVAGGPTHVHGMSKAATRKAAVDQAQKKAGQPALDADAEGPGLSDWFGSLGHMSACAAAFDTRLTGPAVFTGRASKGIARLLERHGLRLIAQPESFLVTGNTLQQGEEDRAQEWGQALAAQMPSATEVRP